MTGQVTLPKYLADAGVDPAKVPRPEALERVRPLQSTRLAPVTSAGTQNLIYIDDYNRLDIAWGISTRGITLTPVLYVFGGVYALPSASIDMRSPSLQVQGPDILGWQATITAGVDVTQCRLFVSGSLRCGFPLWTTLQGDLAVPYARPWPNLTPGVGDAAEVTPEMLQALRKEPPRDFRPPPAGFIQNDPVTSEAVRTLLWLTNGAQYIDAVRLAALRIADTDADFDPGQLLLAISVGGQGGVGLGLEGALGVYITGAGEVGFFGSVGIDVGVFVGLAVEGDLYLFWTGTRGLGGVSMGLAVGAGTTLPDLPFGPGVSLAIYWSFGQPQSAAPSGMSVGLNLGLSLIPIEGYAFFSFTFGLKLLQLWNLQEALPAAEPSAATLAGATD